VDHGAASLFGEIAGRALASSKSPDDRADLVRQSRPEFYAIRSISRVRPPVPGGFSSVYLPGKLKVRFRPIKPSDEEEMRGSSIASRTREYYRSPIRATSKCRNT
jgi:hypothetical protein